MMGTMKGWLLAAALAGCYHPNPKAGAACATNGDCPSPFSCIAGVCGGGGGSGIDAPAGSDAPMIDGRPDAPGNMIASNGVVGTFPPGGIDVLISGIATFNTDTGEITGSYTRSAGTGAINGVDFETATYMSAPLGVFSFHRLTVSSTGHVHFTGVAAAVFVVAVTAQVDGEIDGSGGSCGGPHSCPGPGGGHGGTSATAALGCGPGGAGVHDAGTTADTGGGGGGGAIAGAAGGSETGSATYVGGAAGAACVTADLQPLVGGSGGGIGSPGDAAITPAGGGGGGAFQLTSFGSISITGRLGFNGAGGVGGPASTATDAGAGAGGGAGGGILLEAPTLTISQTAILAANGGGGGGGGYLTTAGSTGTAGGDTATAAMGGAAASPGLGTGGNGAAAALAPTKGGNDMFNAGGGGGAVGAIYLRSTTPMVSSTATISPAAGTGPVLTQ